MAHIATSASPERRGRSPTSTRAAGQSLSRSPARLPATFASSAAPGSGASPQHARAVAGQYMPGTMPAVCRPQALAGDVERGAFGGKGFKPGLGAPLLAGNGGGARQDWRPWLPLLALAALALVFLALACSNARGGAEQHAASPFARDGPEQRIGIPLARGGAERRIEEQQDS